MAEPSSSCPRCGTPLSHLRPGAPCPRCVADFYLASEAGDGLEPTHETENGSSPGAAWAALVTPPNPAEHASLGGAVPRDSAENLVWGEVIGEGGMGAVYEVEDRSLGRRVVAKRLRAERQTDGEAQARFLAEARITAQLEHPGIVPVHTLGTDAQGRVFYTMRRIRGQTLATILERLKARDTEAVAHYPLAVLLTILQKVCDAVAYAHARGVIHRDLKPTNVMVGEFGEVVVMDWGLAKVTGVAEARPETEPGRPPL